MGSADYGPCADNFPGWRLCRQRPVPNPARPKPWAAPKAWPGSWLSCGGNGTAALGHEALAHLAASLAFALARNHPFVDGNKRTAYVVYRTFLALNGTDLDATDKDKYLAMLALAEGKLSEKDFAVWLRAHLRADTRSKVHEPRIVYKPKARVRKTSRKRARRAR